MPLYLVHLPNGTDRLTNTFPFHYTLTEGSLWAIASDLLTCADVCQRLGMVSGQGGVVVKFEEYYGVYDPAFWDALRVWGGGR